MITYSNDNCNVQYTSVITDSEIFNYLQSVSKLSDKMFSAITQISILNINEEGDLFGFVFFVLDFNQSSRQIDKIIVVITATMASKYGQISNKNVSHRSYPYALYHETENQVPPDSYSNSKPPRKNGSPFAYKEPSGESSGMDSIDNLMDKSNNPYGTNAYESEEIVFLKEKIIETHTKLLRELEANHKLTEKLQAMEDALHNGESRNRQLEEKSQALQGEVDQLRRILERNEEKISQKYRSVEGRLENENRRNQQLKEELDTTKKQFSQINIQRNILQESNNNLKAQLKQVSGNIANLEDELKQKDEKIVSINREMRQVGQKLQKSQNLVTKFRNEVDQLNQQLGSQKQQDNELNHLYHLEKEKNQNLQHELADMENYIRQLEQKNITLEKELDKCKDEYYKLKDSKQTTARSLTQQINKLTEDLESLNVVYKETERQLSGLKKKPIQDAEKKKRHYEITKQFVNQLENQQQLYGNAGSRAIGYSNVVKSPLNAPKLNRDTSPSMVSFNNNNNTTIQTTASPGYFQNRATNNNSYSNLMNKKQVAQRSESKGTRIAELDGMLFNLNLEHKKIKMEIEKLETHSLKTREMIVRKKKLEEELNYQEEKIKKVKDDLRKLRVM